MRTELKHLQRQFKQTMVYVTHDQLEAMTMADRIAVMDHGVLQQVGTPLEVYNDPVNLFVADFIGSPGMNLVKGTLAESDRGIVVDLGNLGVTAPLEPALAAAARAQAARDVVFGFRPERVVLAGSGTGLAVSVTFVERIGARTVAHFGDGDRRVKAVFDNDVAIRMGETVQLAIEPGAARLFDAATGNAIRGA
jgi:multiple sugar transport system ATP-binding protein